MKMAFPLRSLWEGRGLLAFSSLHPARGVPIMPATEHEGIGGSSSKVRRTKNMFRHHNLSSKPHSGAFSALLIFWTVSYLHSTGCDVHQPLTWKCRNLCFSCPSSSPPTNPLSSQGFPSPYRPVCKLGGASLPQDVLLPSIGKFP